MGVAVLACALGAAAALLAATRTWTTVDSVGQYAPVSGLHGGGRTGVDAEPWLSALALVGLAGAGALLATRGRSRMLIGVLLIACGLGVLAGGADGLANIAGVRPAWPAVAIAGAVLIAYGGTQAALRGRTWPSMGARYERPAGPATPAEDRPQHIGPSRSDVEMWDALDRGEDPTHPGR